MLKKPEDLKRGSGFGPTEVEVKKSDETKRYRSAKLSAVAFRVTLTGRYYLRNEVLIWGEVRCGIHDGSEWTVEVSHISGMA